MNVEVRSAFEEDAEDLAEIAYRSVTILGTRAYSGAQIDAWAAAMPHAETWRKGLGEQRHIWIAELNGEPSGFIELDGGMQIEYFYVAPSAAATNVAPALYGTAETYARTNGALMLVTDASKLLKPFLERRNWHVLGAETVELSGVSIERYRMAKRLVDANGAYVRSFCERCYRALPPGEARFACKYRDTYCESCFDEHEGKCPACGNGLVQVA